MPNNTNNSFLPANRNPGTEIIRREDGSLIPYVDTNIEGIDVEINVDSCIDLKELFPLSKLYALRNTLPWILALLAGVLIYWLLVTFTNLLPNGSWFREHKLFLLSFASVIVLTKLVYTYAYGKTLKYRIDGFRLNVSKGVFWPEIGSIPLVPFHETYVWQTPADLLLGVHSFQHMLGMDPSGCFLRIHGFTKESAYSFQAFLAHILSKQVYMPQNEMKARMVIN